MLLANIQGLLCFLWIGGLHTGDPTESNFGENNWGNKPQFHLRERGRLGPSPQDKKYALAESSYFFPQYHKICMIVPIKRKNKLSEMLNNFFKALEVHVPSLTVMSASHPAGTTFQRGVSPCFKTRGVCSSAEAREESSTQEAHSCRHRPTPQELPAAELCHVISLG